MVSFLLEGNPCPSPINPEVFKRINLLGFPSRKGKVELNSMLAKTYRKHTIMVKSMGMGRQLGPNPG